MPIAETKDEHDSCAASRRCAARSASGWSASPGSTTRAPRTRSSARRTGRSSSRRVRTALALRLRATVPVRVRGRRGGGRVHLARRRVRVRSSSSECAPGEESPAARDPDYVADGLQGDGQLLATLGRALLLSGPLARDGEPVGAHPQAPDLAATRLASSPRPTFGLPEAVAGHGTGTTATRGSATHRSRSTALMRLGYTDEAAAFMRWVEARCEELEPDGALQIMYGIDGRHELTEETLPHLEGYLGSKPVRIGNARLRSAPARHLRRADGRHLPVRQVRPADLARSVAQRHALHRLAVRQLAPAGRRHLGGARRPAGVPLLPRAVLGRRRSGMRLAATALLPGALGALARRARRDLPRHLRALLEPEPQGVRAVSGLHHARRLGPAHAPHQVHLAHRPALGLHVPRHRAGAS